MGRNPDFRIEGSNEWKVVHIATGQVIHTLYSKEDAESFITSLEKYRDLSYKMSKEGALSCSLTAF